MLITKISYKRTKSIPGYNSESLELSADVDDDEDVSQAINDLRNIVLYELDIPVESPKPLTKLERKPYTPETPWTPSDAPTIAPF